MKLTTLFIAAVTIIAGAAFTDAVPVEGKPVATWREVVHKHPKYWKLYNVPNFGTDLRNAKPLIHRCKVTHPENRWVIKENFGNSYYYEYQEFDQNHIGVNCPQCTEQEMSNLYHHSLAYYMTCKEWKDEPL